MTKIGGRLLSLCVIPCSSGAESKSELVKAQSLPVAYGGLCVVLVISTLETCSSFVLLDKTPRGLKQSGNYCWGGRRLRKVIDLNVMEPDTMMKASTQTIYTNLYITEEVWLALFCLFYCIM